ADMCTFAPVPGAWVRFGSVQKFADSRGRYVFYNVPRNTEFEAKAKTGSSLRFIVEFSAPGYPFNILIRPWSHKDVTGVVVDAHTGRPIAGATVVSGFGPEAHTDDYSQTSKQGTFDVECGDRLKVDAAGYETARVVVPPTKHVRVELQPDRI